MVFNINLIYKIKIFEKNRIGEKMKQYLDMVKYVLDNGIKKENRTGVDAISTFAYSYRVDLSEGYPLLTTKKNVF